MGLEGDLNLGMLSENDNQEDFSLEEISLSQDLDNQIVNEALKPKEINQDLISEDDKNITPESVAEEDKSKAPEVSKPSPGSDDKLSQIYSSLATTFHEAGVLPSLNLEEKKITSIEQFKEAIQTEIDNAKSESQREYDAAMKGGEPKNDYINYVKQKEMLNGITEDVISSESNSKTRFNIIAQNFINKNFSEEDAIKYARRSQDLGEDIEDSKKALEELKAFNESHYQSKVSSKKQKETENVNKVKDFVNNSNEFIKGVSLTQATKDNLIKQMTTSVGRDEKGEPITEYGKSLIDDPVKTKTVTEYMFMITKGFTDFSKINSLIASKATKDIDDVLRNNAGFLTEDGKVNFNNIDNESTFSINDEFKLDV